jgi:hypothetical protein
MKTRFHSLLGLLIGGMLCSVISVSAQQSQIGSVSELKESLDRLMKFSVTGVSDETRRMHGQALSKTFTHYLAALNNELKSLQDLLTAVGGNDQEARGEILRAIKQWENKLAEAKTEFQKASVQSPVSSDSISVARASTGPATAPGRLAFAASSSSAVTSSAPNNAAASTPREGATIPRTAKVCGQISLASLSKVMALIKASQSDINKNKLADLMKEGSFESAFENIRSSLKSESELFHSRLKNDCEPDDLRALGAQKNAAIKLLRSTRSILSTLKGERITGANDPDVSEEWLQKQIVMLEEHLGNVGVYVRNEKGVLIKTLFTDADGNFSTTLTLPATDGDVATEEKSYTITTEADNHYTKREFVPDADNPTRINLVIEDRPVSLLTRAVVGYQQTGAAASGREQNYFFDFFASKSLPFKQKINPDFGERMKVWGAIRISSIPQSNDLTIGGLTTNFATNVANLQVKDSARVFDFLTGVEIFLTGNNALLPSFDRQTRMKFALSFIAGGGVVTPEEPRDRLTSFKYPAEGKGLPPEIKALVADPKATEFLTFAPKDRDRFFRQYYAGLRIQSFFFNKYNVPIQRFPAQLDLTVGQNEYVSGGNLRGPVVRIDGYFPLPYEQLKFINLFGTAILKPGRANISNPLVLDPADGIKLGGNVALIPYNQFSRDYYKAGVGIDFITFVGMLKNALNKN